MSNVFKPIAVIPSHLASVRFPKKILYPFLGLPMIEHVRRRAVLSSCFSEVYVATCDQEIIDMISPFTSNIILTSNSHVNGTSRVCEAVTNLDCSHVVILQGDEPLMLPQHLITLTECMKSDLVSDAWNATATLDSIGQLDAHSFVKCIVSENHRIHYLFRRSPSFNHFDIQCKYVRKILGLIAFKKQFLMDLYSYSQSLIEYHESIEQLRVIFNGGILTSVPVNPSLPSLNEPQDEEIIHDLMSSSSIQKSILDHILAPNFCDSAISYE